MAKLNEMTWRENKVTLKTSTVNTQFFSDTKPNHIWVTNRSSAFLYLSVNGDASKDNYNIKIPANAQKLLARPIGTDRCSFYHEQGYDIQITLASWEGDFEPASLSQSLETVSIDPTSPEVEISNDKGNPVPITGTIGVSNFPPTQQVSGAVGVNNFPTQFGINNFPASQNVIVTGNNAQQPFSDTVSKTITFTGTMKGLVFNNDGASDVTVKIGADTFTVKPGKTFNEYLAPFTQIIVTATTPYSGYVRG